MPKLLAVSYEYKTYMDIKGNNGIFFKNSKNPNLRLLYSPYFRVIKTVIFNMTHLRENHTIERDLQGAVALPSPHW